MQHFDNFKSIIKRRCEYQEQLACIEFANRHRGIWLKAGVAIGMLTGIGLGAAIALAIQKL